MAHKHASSLLEQINVHAVMASDGQEAFTLFRDSARRPDLILMDLHMPVMDGYESAKKIREISPDVPIIAMTANVFGEDRQTCFDAGMNDYIAKPYDLQPLFATLLKWLEKSSTT